MVSGDSASIRAMSARHQYAEPWMSDAIKSFIERSFLVFSKAYPIRDAGRSEVDASKPYLTTAGVWLAGKL